MSTATSELTGRPVDTYSEEWRHECECRAVLAMPGADARNAFLFGVERRRGEAAAYRLRVDVAALALLRNPAMHDQFIDSFARNVGRKFAADAVARLGQILADREEAAKTKCAHPAP